MATTELAPESGPRTGVKGEQLLYMGEKIHIWEALPNDYQRRCLLLQGIVFARSLYSIDEQVTNKIAGKLITRAFYEDRRYKEDHLKMTSVSIRRATAADSPAVSYICLATADAGVSAETLHNAGELPGVMYAEPYVHLPEAFGFVMVDEAKKHDKYGGVVGYVLSTYDTHGFEQSMRDRWLPPYLEKYPLSAVDPDTKPDADTPAHLRGFTLQDKHYIRTIHNLPTASDACVAFSPAHLHVDILPEYQRQGWGRKLIAEVVRYLKEEKGLDGLWLGMDPRNENARKFYERLGFTVIPGGPFGVVGLKFENWRE
ncbi:hypothetical protein EIP86_001808 [Pleurotus ostreatoroseus]|nr:hypothetical protein EIP86_001808 [Pleurotus ostreatoroseus]